MRNEEPKPKKKRVVKSAFIDHTYHDYAGAPNQHPGNNSNATSTINRIDHSVSKNFPAKLHEIVSTPQYQHIIGWLPHGRSWALRNKELLATVVLKNHFSHGNFESFNRQVNLWGFKRLLRAGPDYKSYYHEAFLRGRPDLTPMMHRLASPGKRIPNLATEPKFYQMPFLPDPQLQSGCLSSSTTLCLNGNTEARASGNSNVIGRSGSDRPFEQYASAPRNYRGGAPDFQQFQSRHSHVMQSNPCVSQTSSGESKHSSDKNRNVSHNHSQFSDTNQSQESVQRLEAGNVNVGTRSYSVVEKAHHSLSASAPESNSDEQGKATISESAGGIRSHHYKDNESNVSQIHRWSDYKQGNIRTDVTTSEALTYSSRNEIPQIRSLSTLSGVDSNQFNARGLPSNVDRTITQHNHYSSEAGLNDDAKEARADATPNMNQNVMMAQQSIALLSNPPNDPMLEEFANEFLGYFGKKDDDDGS